MSYLKRILPAFAKNIALKIVVRLNAQRFGIDAFMKSMATMVKTSDRVLDAGAGNSLYREMFPQVRYESTDITTEFCRPGEHHSYISELHNLPIRNDSYDGIINTEVLEHVEYPQKVVNEFYRILKLNGQLFLTTPQSRGIHMAPYNFYYFTKYGLESLFKNAGFEIISVSPIGGIFWNLAKIFSKVPNVLREYSKRKILMAQIFLYPLHLVSRPLCEIMIPLLFFYLDRIYLNQGWTIGYTCHCKKRSLKVDPAE